MRFSTSAALSATVMAAGVLAQDATCQIGHQEILYPAANTNITAANGGYTFAFRYCSGQYFKTSTKNIKVILSNAANSAPFDGIVLAEADATGGLDGGYVFNLTAPLEDGDAPPSESTLSVFEVYNNYYTPLGSTVTTIPVQF